MLRTPSFGLSGTLNGTLLKLDLTFYWRCWKTFRYVVVIFLSHLTFRIGPYFSLVSCQASEFCNQFYKTYFLTIEQEIFAVLTDTFHKPGFKLHVLVLQHLFCLVRFLLIHYTIFFFLIFVCIFSFPNKPVPIVMKQVESGILTEPLWDVAAVPYPYPNNAMYIREYTIKLLSSSFPNMTATEVWK